MSVRIVDEFQNLINAFSAWIGGYKIAPRPCEVSGVQGTCMFVWECLKVRQRRKKHDNINNIGIGSSIG